MTHPDSNPLQGLSVVPDRIRVLELSLQWQDRIDNCLADNECEHGRLHGDTTPACGCWPAESAAA